MVVLNNERNNDKKNQFIHQPAEEVGELFNKSKAKTIILFGERGSGRTTILSNYQSSSLETANPAIYTKFNSIGLFGDDRNGWKANFDDDYAAYYYELLMANKILIYIATNYPGIYGNYFADEKKQVVRLIEETSLCIWESPQKNVPLVSRFRVGDFTEKFVSRLKRIIDLNGITLLIDQFDWTDGNSLTAQAILSKYFKIFDRTIITTDDKSLMSKKKRRNQLSQSGIDFIEISYGKNIYAVKEIILFTIEQLNLSLANKNYSFPSDMLTDDLILKLIEKANGNLRIITNTVNNIIKMWQREYNYPSDSSIENAVKRTVSTQLSNEKKLQKKMKPIKFKYSLR